MSRKTGETIHSFGYLHLHLMELFLEIEGLSMLAVWSSSQSSGLSLSISCQNTATLVACLLSLPQHVASDCRTRTGDTAVVSYLIFLGQSSQMNIQAALEVIDMSACVHTGTSAHELGSFELGSF